MCLGTCFNITLEQSQRGSFLDDSRYSKGMNKYVLKEDDSGFALHPTPALVVPPLPTKAFTWSFGTHCFAGFIFY